MGRKQFYGYIVVAFIGIGLLVPVAPLHGAIQGASVSMQDVEGVIHGQITDSGSGEPLAGAHVRILELSRDELTHEDGGFRFTRVPAGRYTLIVERLGYRRETRVVEVEAGESAYLNVALQFSAIQLSGITVTGTVGQQLSEEALRTTTVLGGQDLARNLDATVAATLENVPGVASVSTGPATARPVIRGLGGDRILILEDGGRIGDLSASSPDHAVAVEAVTAKQIEVVRGPAALLYGSNALGGIVNVIREDIPSSLTDQVHGGVSLQGQSVNESLTGGGWLLGSLGPIALRVEGSARTAGDLRTPIGKLENTAAETYNFSAGGSWVNGWGHAGLAYRFYASDYGVPGFGHDHNHDHGDHDHDEHDHGHDHADGVNIEMRRHTVRGEALVRRDVGPFSSIKFDGTFSNYHHRELEADGHVGTEYDLLSSTGGVVAQHGAIGPFSEGAVGIQAHWRDFSAGGSLVAPPSNEYSIAGFFLEELDLNPVRLQVGARYDWHQIVPRETETIVDIGEIRTRTFGSVSASLGALYDFGAGIALGANVGRAFRTPDVTELYSQGPHLATYSVEIGNPDLEAETALGTDLFLRITRDRFTGEVAVFQNRISNYIYPRNTGLLSDDGLPIYRFVGDDAILSGVEGEAKLNVAGGLVVDGTVSYVRGTLRDDDLPLPLIPPMSGRLDVRYEAPKFFVGAGVKLAARQDRVGEFEEPTDGYHVFDATAGYRWVAFGRIHSLTLKAENLTDTEYRDHLSRVKAIMPQAGRSLSLLYRVSI